MGFFLLCQGMPVYGDDFLDEMAFDSNKNKSSLVTSFDHVCTPKEKWDFAGNVETTIPRDARNEFFLHLKGERLPFASFAEVRGWAPRFTAPEAKAFATYWEGRALFSAKLYAESAQVFNSLISRNPDHRRLPFQKASIACLDRIHEIASHISYSKEALSNLVQFYNPMLITERDLQLLSRPAVHFVFQKIKEGSPRVVNHALLLLENGGALENLVRAMWGVRQRDMETASFYLKKLLSTKELPADIEARRNQLRLLLATALYEVEDYTGAIEQLEVVDRRSNELVDGMSRLASAHLMAGNYTKAIGTAVTLNSGDFQRTFIPEIYMVLSMALNEMCRFPEAFNVVSEFKRQYDKTYHWLAKRKENGGTDSRPIYPILVDYVRGKRTDVPERVLSEWARSPVFLDLQKGINTVFETVQSLPSLRFQVQLAIQRAGEAVNERTEALERAAAEHGTTMHPELMAAKRAAQHAEARFARIDAGRDPWKELLAQFQGTAARQQQEAVAKLESHLQKLTRRMFRQLTRVVENNELVEAEILTGVSQDIIMSNAKKPNQRGRVRRPAHTSYKWSTRGEALAGIEVWEDEVGTLEASVENKCPGSQKRKVN